MSLLEVDDSRGARRALNYLGVLGTAMLVSLDGEVALASGDADPDWLGPIAESVAACARANATSRNRIGSLASLGACAYFARVGASGAVVLIVERPVAPSLVLERFSRVLAVFDRVMGAPNSPTPEGSGGAPAAASIFALAKSR